MYCPYLSSLLAACFLVLPNFGAQSQTVQSIIWNIPDGQLADLSQTFSAGVTLPLSWNKYVSTDYVDTTKNLVHLWVSAFDYGLNPFSQLLKENVNLTFGGTYDWTIAIPDSNLSVGAKYVLRFKAAASTFDPDSGDLSSPGFLVLRASASTSTTSISTTTALPSSSLTTASIVTSSASVMTGESPSSSHALSESTEGLTTGGKAGIGIGTAVGVLALAGVGYFFFRRTRDGEGTSTEPPMYQDHPPTNLEAEGQDKCLYPNTNAPVELPGRDEWRQAELSGR